RSLQNRVVEWGWVRALAFSPDGSLLASGSYDRRLRVWDVRTGRLLAWLPCADTVLAVEFVTPASPHTGPRLVAVDAGGGTGSPGTYVLQLQGLLAPGGDDHDGEPNRTDRGRGRRQAHGHH